MDRINMIHPISEKRQLVITIGNGVYKFADGQIVTNNDIIKLNLDPKVVTS